MANFYFVGEHPCVDFINTEAVENGVPVDKLATFDDLAAWAVEAKLVEARRWPASREADKVVARARAFRTTLRRMIEGLAEGRRTVPPATLDEINEILRARTGTLELVRTKAGYETRFQARLTEPGDLLVRVAESAADLLSHADLSLIKKCSNPACVLYFYDTTKNHARRWCSMSACGNRAKVAAHYQRLRGEA
jgi:predicted RNA-binding Zn ribbon-like protein